MLTALAFLLIALLEWFCIASLIQQGRDYGAQQRRERRVRLAELEGWYEREAWPE